MEIDLVVLSCFGESPPSLPPLHLEDAERVGKKKKNRAKAKPDATRH
jgi:hypothetical protein